MKRQIRREWRTYEKAKKEKNMRMTTARIQTQNIYLRDKKHNHLIKIPKENILCKNDSLFFFILKHYIYFYFIFLFKCNITMQRARNNHILEYISPHFYIFIISSDKKNTCRYIGKRQSKIEQNKNKLSVGLDDQQKKKYRRKKIIYEY